MTRRVANVWAGILACQSNAVVLRDDRHRMPDAAAEIALSLAAAAKYDALGDSPQSMHLSRRHYQHSKRIIMSR